MTTVCPNCGTPRMGSFRFCRSCGLDYEPSAAAAGPVPGILTPVPETAIPTGSSAALAAAVPAGSPAFVLDGAPAPAPISGGSAEQPSSTVDVIAVPVEPLERAAGAIVGGLIGAMLTGAVIVPYLGDSRILLGVVAAIVTISVSALLGVRAVIALVGR